VFDETLRLYSTMIGINTPPRIHPQSPAKQKTQPYELGNLSKPVMSF